MQIIDGKAMAEKIRAEVRTGAVEFQKKHGRRAGLAVVLVGDNPASEIYINLKTKSFADANMELFLYRLDTFVNDADIIKLVKQLNTEPTVDGILVQQPLPDHLNTPLIVNTVAPNKDVDGLTKPSPFTPCTPLGCLEMIRACFPQSKDNPLAGLHAVVVGRSNIVGRPMARLLLDNDCTVTVCHSKTVDLKSYTKTADILVVAVGKPKLITAPMVKKGAIVIDVGINRTPDGAICGDVDFPNVSPITSHISPVPNGVGPMTIAILLKNTLASGNCNAR